MTKFLNAQKQGKDDLSSLSRLGKKSRASTPPPTDERLPEIGVRFVLVDGTSLKARSNDLEEDDLCIYGTLFSGKSFAVPINNILYCMEI